MAELDLSQFEKETVESVIAFLYSGKIEFKGNGDISKLAEAADYLLMPDLFELCLSFVWADLMNSRQRPSRCLCWRSS